MENPYQIIQNVSVTEKSHTLVEFNQYAFIVHPKANKKDIKRAVETLFERKVDAVNVMNRKGKSRRNRFGLGRRPNWRKAIVTLKKGEEAIELF
ncbi:MAG: large subunit ribosomal protein L23 [Rhodothermales bacterium]|jgi:large subunit ribosomal protein L23